MRNVIKWAEKFLKKDFKWWWWWILLQDQYKWYIHLKTHPSDLPEVFIKTGWSVLGSYQHLILIFLQQREIYGYASHSHSATLCLYLRQQWPAASDKWSNSYVYSTKHKNPTPTQIGNSVVQPTAKQCSRNPQVLLPKNKIQCTVVILHLHAFNHVKDSYTPQCQYISHDGTW